MRYLGDVLERIISISTNKKLNEDLFKIRGKLPFKAPELHFELWHEVGDALNGYIPNPVENEETIKIVSVWTTLTEDEVKDRWSMVRCDD